MEFFTELEGARRDYVFETLEDQFRRSAENVASATTTIQEAGGNEVITQALARIPAFTAASVTTGATSGPTIELVPVRSGHIDTLLLPSEVAALAGVELTIQYRDLRAGAASVDPAQVEHMDSFDSLSFDTADGFKGVTLSTVKFYSESAATDHLELVTTETPGLQELSGNIGDTSLYAEVNESGIWSMVFFKKGLWVVTLHTAQPDGARPLVDITAVETLARIVANRL